MGLGGFFMHSRVGLNTPYLSEEWFDCIRACIDEAKRQHMNAWLYDEDRWPSGAAGGLVTRDPQFRQRYLSLTLATTLPEQTSPDTIATFAAHLDGVTASGIRRFRPGQDTLADGETLLIFEDKATTPSSWFNDQTYLDTMNPKAVAKFIETTHEAYKRHIAADFGKTVPGIFTDEPNYYHGGGQFIRPWTTALPAEFSRLNGYDLIDHLPELFFRPDGQTCSKTRLDYYNTATTLYVNAFSRLYGEWCERNHLLFTGHDLNEDDPIAQTATVGAAMRFYEFQQQPGIDLLTEHWGIFDTAKQCSSMAHQFGRRWRLSETYGCTGWDFPFMGHKALGDWQFATGINFRCQHLAWYSMAAEAKRDYPASISYQSPWYKYFGMVEDYFARMGLVLSEGAPACDVLLLNPIESVWCQAYAGWAQWISNVSPDVAPYERRYAQLFHYLTDHQIDFDYGEEEMMSRMASIATADGTPILRVGQASYKTVIVSNMLTIRPTTLALLKEFMDIGGKVIFCGDAPTYVNAIASDEPAKLAEQGIVIPYDEEALVSAVRENACEFVSITNGEGETEKAVFAQVRKDFGGDGYAVVVLNTDRKQPRENLTLAVKAPAGYAVEEWDLENGTRYNASAMAGEVGGTYYISMDLEAAGTRCFVLTKTPEELPAVTEYETVASETLTGEFPYAAHEPNVCVLDWCKWRWKDGEWHDEAEALWADRQIRSDIGIEWRGGGMLQPWYAKLNDTKKYGELQLSYEFYIEEMPEFDVILAGERPELNQYKINGVELHNDDINDFWVDDCFKKMKIPAEALKLGRNEVTIDVTFMRTTNVEALYLVGVFGVKVDGKKRTIVGIPGLIGCDNYAAYHMPFYTGNMEYILTPEDFENILGDAAKDADRIVLTPKEFTGGCVKVVAAGKTTVLGWDPYEADVTEAYRNGLPISVIVEGVRTNVFGPLHEVAKPAGACGPGNFVTGGDQWTDDYSLLKSGLRGFIFKAQKKA